MILKSLKSLELIIIKNENIDNVVFRIIKVIGLGTKCIRIWDGSDFFD